MKTIHPEHAEKILSKAKQEHSFKLHMGTEISSLKGLAEAMDIMSEETFNHHVNEKKNDFSNWIENVFEDSELAEEIRPLKSRDSIKKKIIARMKFLEKRAKAGRPMFYDEYMDHPVRDFVLGVLVGIVLGFLIKYIAMVFG